jgi:ribosome-associated protein
MDIRKLQRAIVDGLEDVKAHNIVVFNTEHLSPLFERVIVASGNSNRQTKALASSVRETVKARGLPILSVEGAENGEWIIVDCGAAVAHIMQPTIRDYYRLEEIWGGKSVKMKMDGEAGPLTAGPLPPAHAPGRRAAPARRAQAKVGAAKKPAPAKKRPPAKKPVATKKTAVGVRKIARKSTARTR